MSNKRTYDRDEPVALDDRDPGNTDIEKLVQPLDPDDDVFALINQAAPAQEPTAGD